MTWAGRRGRMRKTIMLALMCAGAVQALEAQSMRTVTMSRQIEDNQEVQVAVEYAVGRFSVRSVDEGLLYRMNLSYDEDSFEPVAEYSGHRLEVGVESMGRRGGRRDRESGELELELARGVPMDLDLEFGAVRADLDLGGLALTDLELSTGASESTIDISELNREHMQTARFEVGAAKFTIHNLGNLNADAIEVDAGVGSLVLGLEGDWQRNAELTIDMGLGVLELQIPEGLGIQLRKESFLTALDSEGLVKRGDTYETLDWDDAEHRVTIELDAAFGSVKVVWIS
jgi:hypothetical protein